MSSIPQWSRGDRLRKAREHAGLTQAELAMQVGLGKNTVTRYETDQVEPRRPAIILWAVATDVDVQWIETGVASESDVDRLRHKQTSDALEKILRARRDSNPQPSDLESRTCIVCGHSAASHRSGGRCAYFGCPCAGIVFTGRREDLAVAA